MATKSTRRRVRLSQERKQEPQSTALVPAPLSLKPRSGLGDTTFREAQEQLELTDAQDYAQSREFGLGLALVGLAEAQASRLQRVFSLLRMVEDRFADPEFLNALQDPNLLLDVYKALTNTVKQSGEAIAHVFEAVDLDKLRLLRDRTAPKPVAAIEVVPTQVLDELKDVQRRINPMALLHALQQREEVGH